MKGYVKAAAPVLRRGARLKDGKPPAGPAYDEAVNVTARYTGATPEIIRVGFPYQDRDARLDVADIGRQLLWYHKAGMVTAPSRPATSWTRLSSRRRYARSLAEGAAARHAPGGHAAGDGAPRPSGAEAAGAPCSASSWSPTAVRSRCA
jgi:hypothetical protein